MAWSMDFVSDQTSSGTKFRALTIVDVFTRECLAIEPGQSWKGEDVARVLTAIAWTRPLPQRIHCDNGSEFAGRSMDLWAYANKVILEFSRPGKPTDNAYIESFNGSLRDECLNVHWFADLTDARTILRKNPLVSAVVELLILMLITMALLSVMTDVTPMHLKLSLVLVDAE